MNEPFSRNGGGGGGGDQGLAHLSSSCGRRQQFDLDEWLDLLQEPAKRLPGIFQARMAYDDS